MTVSAQSITRAVLDTASATIIFAIYAVATVICLPIAVFRMVRLKWRRLVVWAYFKGDADAADRDRWKGI